MGPLREDSTETTNSASLRRTRGGQDSGFDPGIRHAV
jgi:hypothetical protein